jgi:exodeoxyribonuclease V gamma subunit
LASPFGAETVVVASPAMGRWINLQLACENGLAANTDYPLPASWVWDLAHRLLCGLPERDPLGPEPAAWKIFSALPGLLEQGEFSSLRHYLADDHDTVKRWQLSSRIACLFDRYQFYRPDLIRKWSRGQESDWQARLWMKLIQGGESTHRVQVIDRMIELLRSNQAVSDLPERALLFAVSSLPPLFVELIQALADKIQVCMYIHSPSLHYWADLTTKKTISRIRVHQPEKAVYYESGNELLASWGCQGQILQDLLLNGEGLRSVSDEFYQSPSPDSLLHKIQNSILDVESSLSDASADPSIQIHVCHSPLRECQVLHDRLLDFMDQDDSLRPEQVLVMVPRINHYAPYIQAVFGRRENDTRPFIPWNLSDIAAVEQYPLVEAFFQLLRLPESRFTFSEVLAFLDLPELATRFDLDGKNRETVLEYARLANVRWGIDAQHKQSLGLPVFEQNTWREARRRFFAGYAIGDTDDWNGVAPLAGIDGDRAKALGRFWLFIQTLIDYRRSLLKPRDGTAWQENLAQMLDRFFSEHADQNDRIQMIRDTLDELKQHATRQILTRNLVLHWLREKLGEKTSSNRYFSGGISFCGMRPMRSLPFRIICVLGMNEPDFPRRQQSVDFDLMRREWKPGDPVKGDEDRYLMLETLLCTRDIFYISYTGRDMRDNSECQPSVLVRDLVDFIDRSALAKDPDDQKRSEQLTVLHPMQPFNARIFNLSRPGYDQYWHGVALTLAHPPAKKSRVQWPVASITQANHAFRVLDLPRFHQFIRHPLRFFFSRGLKIRFSEPVQSEDSEVFSLGSLDQWRLKMDLAERFMACGEASFRQGEKANSFPHGSMGTLSREEVLENSRIWLSRLSDYAYIPSSGRTIEIDFADAHVLAGKVRNYYPGKGLLQFSPSKFGGSQLLALWIDHLCLSTHGHYRSGECARLVCMDQGWQYAPLPENQAHDFLNKYIQQYLYSIRAPLAILPKSSYEWARESIRGKPERAFSSAKKRWQGVYTRGFPGEQDDPYVRMAVRGLEGNLLEDPEFVRCSMAFYQDALIHGEPI